MQWLAALCVKRPVFASVLILSLTVVGAFAFTLLGVDRFPKVDFPTVVVTTVQPGAAPEQIETEVSDKIEEAVNTISGIDELRSISSEGVSQVMISFLLEKDPDVAAQEVRDKINGVLPLLPKTIQQPRVDRFDPDAAPVLSLALSANRPIRRHHRVRGQGAAAAARKRERRRAGARPRRTSAPDQRLAGRRPAARLQPDGHGRRARASGPEHRDSWRSHGPGPAVGDAAHERPRAERGRVRRHRRSREGRPPGPGQRRRERRRRRSGAGNRRQRRTAPARSCCRFAVSPARTPSRSFAPFEGASTSSKHACRSATTHASCATPRTSSRRRFTTSRNISSSDRSWRRWSCCSSWPNLRSTIISAIAIPTSIIATFGLIWYMGFTLNLMTMLALTLSVGIVIDDAIVVLENIYRFIEEKHEDQFQAAIDATQEIGLAVLATTLSLVAIFVPVGFMGGHRRPIHEELRPDDGVRDHGVAGGQLHADADAVRALAEDRPVRRRTTGTRRRTPGSFTPSTSSTREFSSGRWPIEGSWLVWRCSCSCRASRSS